MKSILSPSGKFLFLILGMALHPLPSAAQWQQTGPLGSAYGLTVQGADVYSCLYQEGVHRSTDHGATWAPVDSAVPASALWAIASFNTAIFVGTQVSSTFRSTDSGGSWDDIGLNSVRGFVRHRDTLFACQWGPPTVSWSTDNGTSWTETGALTGAGGLWPILSKGSNLFVGGQVGGVYRSTNNGTSWSAMNNGLTNTTAYALASLDDYLFVGTGGGGVFRSTDDGESWNPVSSGTTVYALLAKDSLMLYGTASFGVFVSRDSGSTWVEANQGLTNFAIVSLASDDQYLYAGTLGSGVFRRPLDNILTSVEPASSNIPGSFRLEQNFPNPFNPVTTINYTLPVHTHVTLTVSDVVGREVARLVDGFQEPGYKSVTFDGSTLSSGVYFYRIQAGSFLETKKLILMK